MINSFVLFYIGVVIFIVELVGFASCVYRGNALFATLYAICCLFMFIAAAYPWGK